MVNFLQINLNRNWAAEQLMFQTAIETEADILIVSEPFRRCGDEIRWCFSEDRMAAVASTTRTAMTHDGQGHGGGFAWMSFQNLTIFSCYCRPGTTINEYALFLSELEAAIRGRGVCELIVAGDFNAWSVEWGSRTNNPRGQLLSDMVNSLGLTVANVGSTPTFRRAEATSIIDVTFSKNTNVTDWRVLEVDSLSDHMLVSFRSESRMLAADPVEPPSNELRGWAVRKRDDDALADYLTGSRLEVPTGDSTAANALASADALDGYLIGACEASMPRRRRGPPGKTPVHWWSDEIADLRRNCLTLRRRYQARLSQPGQPGVEESRIAFTTARKVLRTSIKTAKAKCWSDLCDQVDHDPWGKPYRIVMKKFGRRPPGSDSKGKESAIADHLFPADAVTNWDEAPSPAVYNIFEAFDPVSNTFEFTRVIPPFTPPELLRAVKRLAPGKAPGPSGIPNEVIKMVVARHHRKALQVFNNCLSALTFPPRWKRARLVLIRKGPDKPIDQPSSFRPICMLDHSGKILERLLLQRLESHLDAHGGRRRSSNQFGFRKGVSTESAIDHVLNIARQAASGPGKKDLCVLITLDVKNAFNSLRWTVIDDAMRKKKVPEYLVEMIRSWLSDRLLLTGDELTPRPVTCGVPQGSVLGPALWNVAYDSLLDMDVPPGVHLVGFADDLAVIGVAKTGGLLEDSVNPTLESIDAWMRGKGLELAHHKSEAVMLTRRWAYTAPNLVIGGHRIVIRPFLRYLGVFIDQRMTFSTHVITVAKKATKSAVALSRLMPNIGGPCQSRRRLLASVVESQLLYAAPTWVDSATSSARTVKNLVRPQRAIALRIIRAYRTVSDEAALVLAGMPPADLLAKERKRIRTRTAAPPIPDAIPISKPAIKRLERSVTITQWQARWASTPKASWTRRLLPDLNRWVGRTVPRMPLTFHMTQALTGHGCFQHYLHKMGRANSPQCTLCGHDSDTAEHTLVSCVFFSGSREELTSRLGRHPSVEDFSEILCGPDFDSLPADTTERSLVLSNAEEDFRLLYRMVESIMSLKEEEERRRQAADGR